jgi:DNA-binding NarL/FixJ family response regulator
MLNILQEAGNKRKNAHRLIWKCEPLRPRKWTLTGNEMVNLTLASSLLVLREGMKALVAPHPEIAVVGEFSRAGDICTRETYHKEEIFVFAEPLFDLTEEIFFEISVRFPPAKVILVARADSMNRLLDNVKIGARGLLTANSAASCFVDAIMTVDAGRAYVSIEMLRMFAQDAKMMRSSNSHKSLSSREFEIFTRIAQGENNSVIGYELDISSKTVSTHKTRLMEKMGLTTVPQLVQYALQNGLINMPKLSSDHAPQSSEHHEKRS